MSKINKEEFDKKNILENALSPYTNFCDGFGCPGGSGNGYILGIILGVGKDKIQFGHVGSNVLDRINTFDLAEVSSAYIGQLNMSIVSSFCGPQGLMWGYDLAKTNLSKVEPLSKERYQNHRGKQINVFSAWPLIKATEKLFGTHNHKVFPIRPGSHVPFAGKNMILEGPKRIYSAIGLGIPVDRNNSAVLLMEDMGWVPLLNGQDTKTYQKMILDSIIRSVIKVGKNQDVEYKSVYVAIRDVKIEFGEMGCALVAAPYFTLARDAVPSNKIEALLDMNLDTWVKYIKK